MQEQRQKEYSAEASSRARARASLPAVETGRGKSSMVSRLISTKSLGFEESDTTVELGDYESLPKGVGGTYKYNWVTLTFIDPEVQLRFIKCKF